MTWKLSLIPQEQVRTAWPTIAPLLAKALPYAAGRTNLRAVFTAALEERQWLWVAFEDDERTISAAFVTHLAQYPGCAALVIDLAGGSRMRGWLRIASATFRNCARDMGADRVELYGRPGWARVLKSCGWQQKLVVMEVDAAPAAEGV